jgi:hypothetical protein
VTAPWSKRIGNSKICCATEKKKRKRKKYIFVQKSPDELEKK